ncbi:MULTISPECIES: RidA family protein [Sinorhizobium]|jgi:enamine deaminase RidA (YjgF/YER057c/UK114 family)|uniref:Enamine deaminase RidA n=1 Tax=Rhizobium meliloti TaxID=382 RepID=A0A2J0Z7Y9_RHIML|nr:MULTISPECIES: RidA family protein [Sinorhizobium]GCA53739.1 enamine/imine deaminase [Sinorhizobium sp. KGO-5]PJR16640.1 enamine deaminase RidA [Sinorhizobium meliloti]RVQ01813.1 RidA family protein [Sinorhizobium meliloti]WEJ13010.1 RidA family protein [Sinorhizobium sp. M103]WEJ18096.1 RidA family protein [Sinorhizobium sp. K101]
MKRDNINALNAPQPRGGYSQAVSVEDFRRMLFVSGQIPVTSDDVVPEGFEAQARQVWLNVDAQLKAAGMSKTDIVKVTTYLADRQHVVANREIRNDYLGSLAPAMTVVITGIFDSAWLMEVEVVAAQ